MRVCSNGNACVCDYVYVRVSVCARPRVREGGGGGRENGCMSVCLCWWKCLLVGG